MTAPERLQTALSFVERINAQDLEGLLEVVSSDSRFFVEGEEAVVGRAALRSAWAGYFEAFPAYGIFVDERLPLADAVYLVGHTTGSHVPDELERVPSSVIWRCEVTEEGVAEWAVFPGTAEYRERFGLGAALD